MTSQPQTFDIILFSLYLCLNLTLRVLLFPPSETDAAYSYFSHLLHSQIFVSHLQSGIFNSDQLFKSQNFPSHLSLGEVHLQRLLVMESGLPEGCVLNTLFLLPAHTDIVAQ